MMVLTMLKNCEFCGKSVYNLLTKDGKKVCAACYQRAWKKGSMEYRERTRKKCSVADCAHLASAQGYCNTHYQRLRRRGAAEDDRYERRGHASVHPLYNSWQVVKRKGAVAYHASWVDFWVFVHDVGDRPGHDYVLRKRIPSEPHGPNNFIWSKHVTELKKRSDKNEYMRAYRAVRPDVFKRAALKKTYGLPLEEYQRLMDVQKGLCAICRQPETMKIKGNVMALSVDHCHTEGTIRGLLCSKCNRGLGYFNHEPELMRKAIEYLGA